MNMTPETLAASPPTTPMSFCSDCGSKKSRCICDAQGSGRSTKRSRSAEGRGAKKGGQPEDMGVGSNLEETINRAAESAATKAAQASDMAWETRMGSIMQKIEEKQDAKIANLEAKLMKELEELKLRHSALEKEAAAWSSEAGSVAGSARSALTSPPMGVTGTNTKQEHSPKKVDIKGFVPNWDKREEQGLTQPEATRWLTNVHNKLSQEVRELIDLEGSKAMNARVINTILSYKIKYEGQVPAMVRDRALTIKRAIDKTLDEEVDLHINSIRPRVVVQAPEWKQVTIKAGARALSILQKLGVINLKPQWTTPMKVYQETAGQRPMLLLEYSEKTGWSLHEGNLRKAGVDKLPKDLMLELSD